MTDDQSRLVPRASAFDREKANRVLQDAHLSVEGVLDALEGCVTPQGIDRDAARAFLAKLGYADPELYDIEGMVDELALVRPVKGVVLSREEARTVIEGITLAAEVTRQWHHLIATPLSAVMTKMQDDLYALAARAEPRS